MRFSFRKFSFLSLAVFLTFGCGDTTEPQEVILTMRNISGYYIARTFTTEINGTTTNQMDVNASIDLVLNADSTTTGLLFMPESPETGDTLSVNLNGTWILNGSNVTLSHDPDTFLEDMTLVFSQTHLTGETTRDRVTYRVVLVL